jgi:hypothetical protein
VKNDYLVRIDAPHFVAGIIVNNNHKCAHWAPILHKTVKIYDGDIKKIYEYYKRKGYKVTFHL